MKRTNTWASSRLGLVPFLAISFAGAWITMIPLWLDGLRRTSAAQGTPRLAALCMILMMLVPALTAFGLTARRRGPREAVRLLGLARATPWRDELRSVAIALTIPLGLTATGLTVATLAGWYTPAHLPGPATITPLLLSALVSIPLYFGEELGWQGYLLPRLLHHGRTRGLLLGGAIWGAWHVPMTALGGSYPGHPVLLGIPVAVVTAMLLGTVIATVRLTTGSVWAAVAAHLSLNEFALPLTRDISTHLIDPLLAGPLSISTWPASTLAVLGIWLTSRRRSGPGDGAAIKFAEKTASAGRSPSPDRGQGCSG
ncbi:MULTISPECIES: CPBP family intramembrane glutamic endopeptidase [Streptomyces]|uniref:CPBP family intramembrane glutamic endopeptidase n=1 Tax=Streptomyces TaxID=1883 RepID=UPI00160258EC|nr:type II CAAX endopeptidase family protein [Streptomyces murinus]MBA9050569.1 membrane protease YdiL (CAAX protease family) [Streptomyces murinus]